MLGSAGHFESIGRIAKSSDRSTESIESNQANTRFSAESQDIFRNQLTPRDRDANGQLDLNFEPDISLNGKEKNSFLPALVVVNPDATNAQNSLEIPNIEDLFGGTRRLEQGKQERNDKEEPIKNSDSNNVAVREFGETQFLPFKKYGAVKPEDPGAATYLTFEGPDGEPLKLASLNGLISTADFRPQEDDSDLLHRINAKRRNRRRSRRRKRRGSKDSASRIAKEASRGQGQKVWKRSGYAGATLNGRFGCAAAVSEKLQSAGVSVPDAGSVKQIDTFLKARAWNRTALSNMYPGCVAIAHKAGKAWQNGGGKAHVGIVDRRGRVCNNESKGGGRWKCESLANAFRSSLDRRYALCPPRR